MSMVINTNSLSLLTQNNLNASQSALNTAIQRLSSGLRINSAKDDAAGQAIANRFTASINGLTQAQANANDGISMAQTTEGALTEVNNNLQRIRDLSVQAANGTNSSSDLNSIQAEITQRLQEIDRLSAQTDFNGTKVLSSNQSLSIQVGASDGQKIGINLQKIDTTALGVNGFNVNNTGTANVAATKNDLTLAAATTSGTAGTAGYTTYSAWVQGATVNGTTDYAQTIVTKTASDTAASTTPRAAATRADVLGVAVAGDTVKLNGSAATIDNYTAAGAGAALRFNSSTGVAAATTNASVQTALIPTSGGQTNALATIGGSSVAIKIDSAGKITDTSGATLYLDTTGSLTLNQSGTLTQAQIGGGGAGDLLRSMNNSTVNVNAVAQAGTIAVTTAGGSTVTYKGGVGASAAGNTWDYSNSLTVADMQAASASATTTTATVGGVANVISGTGAVTQAGSAVFIDPAGVGAAQLSTTANTVTAATVGATTTTTVDYYVHSNGVVMDNAGNQVYKDSAPATTNPTGFTLTATSGSTSTANALSVIDAALAKVDGVRGSLGAVQNRFDSVISNLGTTVTNLSASRSRIQDANYATEVSNMTRAQILQQAGTSVLAQANQTSQGVLTLLR